VGAPGEMIGNEHMSGTVYLFRGNAYGKLSPWAARDQSGLGLNEHGAFYGAAVAIADVNADGTRDLIVGAPGEASGSGPEAGSILLFKGKKGGLPEAWRGMSQSGFDFNEKGDRFGSVLGIGRMYWKGGAEIIVGAPGENQRGVSYLIRSNGNYPKLHRKMRSW